MWQSFKFGHPPLERVECRHAMRAAISLALASLPLQPVRQEAPRKRHSPWSLRASGSDSAGGNTEPPPTCFIFGFGYTALALTRALKAGKWSVSGACTSQEKSAALRAAGIDAHVWSPDDNQKLDIDGVAALSRAQYVLSTVPPVADFSKDPVLHTQRDELIACATRHLRWCGYLSSTSVYGDHGGEWVDENSELRLSGASNAKAAARADAERAWLQLYSHHGVPVHIFRLGGIYGPGRSLLDSARRERPAAGSVSRARHEKQYISRCHVADIVSVLQASMAKPAAGRLYNVVDDDPAPRWEVASLAAALQAGTERYASQPPPVDETLPHGARRDEKRVRNARIKQELGVTLLFPSYRDGLKHISTTSA